MNLETANAPWRPHRWSWRRMSWIGGLFIGVIVALAAYDIVRSHRAAADDTVRGLDTQARVIAEQTARSLQAVDLVLRHIAEAHRAGTLAALGPADLHNFLKDQSVGLVQVEGLALIDAAGNLHAASNQFPMPEPPPNVAALASFQSLATHRDSGFVVDGAMRGVLRPGHWIFPMGRRLETPSGAFAGAVVAAGRVEYFQQFFRDVRLDAGTAVTLMHRNGTLVARHPPMEPALGRRYPAFDALLAARDAGRVVAPRGLSPVDGVDRFGALALVPEQPLAVGVTHDAAVALAAWRDQAAGTALRTLALGLLGVLLLAQLRRQFARLERARGSLEVSRERFALAAAGSDVGIWDWDVASDMIFASVRAREIFGMPPGPDLQSREAWFEGLRIHPDDAPRRRAEIDAHLAGATPVYAGEYRVQHADGAYRWVRVRGLCVRDAQGRPQRMAGSVADIDARRHAEAALRESEERHALAMTGSNEGHWVWDIEHDQAFASARMNQILGMQAEPRQSNYAEYYERIPMHPQDRPRVRQARDEHLAGSQSRLDTEYRIIVPGSGETRWIHARGRCFRNAEGKPIKLAGSIEDITERKRTEDALRQSEERFALAVAGSDDGVWDFDYSAGRVFGSRRARQILGLPLEPETQPMDEWFAAMRLHPDDEPLRLAAMQAHLNGQVPAYEGEWRIRHADGSHRWVRVRGVCVRDAAGTPLRMAGSVSDIDARKRAEDALRDSEERYALAVAGSDDGVWDWDFGAGLAFESARARELQGLPPGAELQPLPELLDSLRVHPDDAPRRAEGIRAHLAGETPAYECEYRVRHDDGGYRWIRVRALCIRGADGTPCRMAGSVSDIDSRTRAEEARRHSDERFALAVAGANDGILDWDIVGDNMYVSARTMQFVGLEYDARPMTRAGWTARVMPRFHPDDAERVLNELRGESGRPPDVHDGEYRVRGADEAYRWMRFRGRSVRDATGRAIRWAGSVSDIDAQKQTEEALRRSEERFALAVAGSNEGLWDWDLTTDSLFLSPRAQEILWAEPGEPQRPRREWITRTEYHPDDQGAVRDAISAHLRGATPHFRAEYRLRHFSGTWRWYRQRGVAVRNAAGRPTRMAGSMEDITERKTAEADRERLEGQLRQAQKLEAIGTLAGGIAHDFNNILSAILGYGEMAQKDAAEGSALRRHLDAALSAAMRAKSLVERILAFSRSGVTERVPVHTQSVVSEALELVAASLPHGIVLEHHLDAGDAAVLGDATQVHQVVMNLCANAVQAMHPPGRLVVTLDLLGTGGSRCATSVLADANHVRLRVRDTGSGIAPQVLERIFDPFFTTKEVGVGTGLGLSLVHGIVTDLGGGIEVESRLGEGSTFTVYLPWQSCVTAAPAVAPADVPTGDGQTVMLVDDEEALVRLGEEMIAGLGYEPVGFTSSAAALACLRADPGRFHAVLSDEAMPEMTGSELVAEIRKIRPDLPIVMMSGYVTAALSERAREAGVAEVLAKPLAARDIARSLANALQGSERPIDHRAAA